MRGFLCRNLDTPDLFTANGVDSEMAAIRVCIDTGAEFNASFRCVCVCGPTDAIVGCGGGAVFSSLPCSPLSYASVLVELLSSFREPVIPCAYYPGDDFKAIPVGTWVTNLLLRLSTVHHNALVLVVAFMRESLKHAAKNGLTELAAARVLATALFRREDAPAAGVCVCV